MCFKPETKVLMADGSNKAMGDVVVGDWVRSWDEQAGVPGKAQVLKKITHMADQLMRVDLAKGAPVHATPDHPFFSVKQGRLVSMDLPFLREFYPTVAQDAVSPLPMEICESSEQLPVACNFTKLPRIAGERQATHTLMLDELHW